MDHILQELRILIGDIRDSVRESVFSEIEEELMDIHSKESEYYTK